MPTNPFEPAQIEAALGGRYRVGSELRVGGQGAVFKATRIKTDDGKVVADEVALKLHLDPRQDVRVEREIRAMQGISHHALARLIEHGLCELSGTRTRYIAWEFIDGQALDHRIASGALGVADIADFAPDVCSAIQVIWSKRIVHRDINPKNVMLRSNGGGVLIDLGGARHLDETSVTALGATFGTHGYLSPEQFRAERALTSASDIFSLGIVILQCLSGSHPTMFDQHRLATSPPRTLTLVPNAPADIVTILDRMLQVRAAFRPTATELQQYFTTLRTQRRK